MNQTGPRTRRLFLCQDDDCPDLCGVRNLLGHLHCIGWKGGCLFPSCEEIVNPPSDQLDLATAQAAKTLHKRNCPGHWEDQKKKQKQKKDSAANNAAVSFTSSWKQEAVDAFPPNVSPEAVLVRPVRERHPQRINHHPISNKSVISVLQMATDLSEQLLQSGIMGPCLFCHLCPKLFIQCVLTEKKTDARRWNLQALQCEEVKNSFPKAPHKPTQNWFCSFSFFICWHPKRCSMLTTKSR